MRDDSNVALLIREVREGLLREIKRQVTINGIDINYSQCLVVRTLARGGPQMPGDLARFLDHNAGAMTRLLDQLEGKGYVQRRPHSQDRRALTIELTRSGEDVARIIGKYIESAQESALRDFKRADRAKLFELLRRMRDGLNS